MSGLHPALTSPTDIMDETIAMTFEADIYPDGVLEVSTNDLVLAHAHIAGDDKETILANARIILWTLLGHVGNYVELHPRGWDL